MIERIHLEIIRSLKELGSLTKAAEKLCLTQPALTHSIKKLENILNVKIWIKDGRELKLTQAGEYLYKKSNEIIPQFQKMEKDLKAISQGRVGQLRIGVECHPCYQWLVKVIKSYLLKWQGVDIDVTRNFQFDGIEALKNRKIDLVITPDYGNHKELLYIPLIEFELRLVVSPEHKLLKKRYIEPEDLINETILTYPVSRDRLDIFTSFLTPVGIEPENHIEIEATEIMLQLVSTGRGVSTFPHWLVKKYNEEFNIKGIPLGKDGIHKKLYMVIRSEDRDVEYLNDFINIGRESSRD